MLTKRIDRNKRKTKSDNYKNLGEYIADLKNEGEKVLYEWHSACLADDYEYAILEIEAVQSLNTRSREDKTYHLAVSFRPEDEAKLSVEMLKDIENSMANALGFSEHQRLCGVHKNTNNIHMHIAFNMIHPQKFTRHEPFRDFYKMSQAARQLEKKYGLAVDNGITPGQEPKFANQKAATVEARSGQQSFESYAKEKQSAILETLKTAKNWNDVHAAFAAYSMTIKPHNNGLSISDLHSTHKKAAMKASDFAHSCSKAQLEKRFGPYQVPEKDTCTPGDNGGTKDRYQAQPLHRAPERGQLYAEFKAGIAERKETLERLKQQETSSFEPIRSKWERERQAVEKGFLPRRTKANLIRDMRQYERDELAAHRKQNSQTKAKLKEKIPYSSWADFLRWKAEQGNEVALAVLRSRDEEIAPEKPRAPENIWEKREQLQEEIRRKEREIQHSTLRGQSKSQLLAILKMQKLTEQEKISLAAVEVGQEKKQEQEAGQAPGGLDRQSSSNQTAMQPIQPENTIYSGIKHRIDNRGVIIFTLPSGGTIRDTGKQIFFSAHDPAAQKAAAGYAKEKWGKQVKLEGNELRFEPTRELERKKERGLGR